MGGSVLKKPKTSKNPAGRGEIEPTTSGLEVRPIDL